MSFKSDIFCCIFVVGNGDQRLHYAVVRIVVASPPLHAANTSLVHVVIIIKQKT